MLFFRASNTKAYTVHEKPSPAVTKGDRAEELVFVKDGFSLFAALVPPIWMIINRLWLVLAGYLIGIFGLIVIFSVLNINDSWLSYISLALSIIIGFEADSLIRWTLERRAWRQIGHITGANSEECERRFFESWLPTVPEVSNRRLVAPPLPGSLDDSAKFPTLPDNARPVERRRWYNLLSRRS